MRPTFKTIGPYEQPIVEAVMNPYEISQDHGMASLLPSAESTRAPVIVWEEGENQLLNLPVR